MIELNALKECHVGAWVLYKPYFGPTAPSDIAVNINQEVGRIKSWNDRFVFVVYRCANIWDDFAKYTAAATDPRELDFIDEIHCEVCPQRHECEFAIQGGSCLPDTFLDIIRKDARDGQNGVFRTGDTSAGGEQEGFLQ